MGLLKNGSLMHHDLQKFQYNTICDAHAFYNSRNWVVESFVLSWEY